MDGGEMPTRDEWLAEQESKKGVVKSNSPENREPHILQGKNKQ
jgi:hypothetical protein